MKTIAEHVALGVLIMALVSRPGVCQEKDKGTPPPSSAKSEEKTSGAETEKQVEPIKIFGFVDQNHDGINDRFVDADGDGINDVTGKPYPHQFKFEDQNEDKVNDLYVDADGDGVNDLNVKFVDEDSDGINDNVIDTDKDFINDITGLRYTKRSLRGYKFGFIKEERLLIRPGFIDENNDGIPDLRERMMGQGLPLPDRLIDRDGDGIDDRRQRMRTLQNRFRGGKE